MQFFESIEYVNLEASFDRDGYHCPFPVLVGRARVGKYAETHGQQPHCREWAKLVKLFHVLPGL